MRVQKGWWAGRVSNKNCKNVGIFVRANNFHNGLPVRLPVETDRHRAPPSQTSENLNSNRTGINTSPPHLLRTSPHHTRIIFLHGIEGDGVSQDSYCISTWGCFTGETCFDRTPGVSLWACYGSTDLPISVEIWADEGRGQLLDGGLKDLNVGGRRVWWNDMGPRGLPKGSYGQRGTLGKLICDLLSQAWYRVAWESSSEWKEIEEEEGEEIRMKQTFITCIIFKKII